MNKQELIRKYEELWKEHSPFHEPVPYTSMVELFLKDLKLLDEPEKVTIPQFVAEIIEYYKKQNATLYDALREKNFNKQYADWLLNEQGAYDKVARAWLDGYEVEEEKRYLVTIKGIVSNFMVLKHNINEDTWYMSNKINYTDLKAYHTKKELEEAGFGWVFDCPGIEIEEVEVNEKQD